MTSVLAASFAGLPNTCRDRVSRVQSQSIDAAIQPIAHDIHGPVEHLVSVFLTPTNEKKAVTFFRAREGALVHY
jgi:hypothetical protein